MPEVIDTNSLFRAAVRIYAEHGYEGTTTQEIARQAGVNEATLFRRYGTKSSLIAATLSHCLAFSHFAKLRASDDAQSDLIAIVGAYRKTFRAFGKRFRPLVGVGGRFFRTAMFLILSADGQSGTQSMRSN